MVQIFLVTRSLHLQHPGMRVFINMSLIIFLKLPCHCQIKKYFLKLNDIVQLSSQAKTNVFLFPVTQSTWTQSCHLEFFLTKFPKKKNYYNFQTRICFNSDLDELVN